MSSPSQVFLCSTGRLVYYRPMQKGFSLVELSIVLVILGLLTGGILAGQSLIRAAELRSVSTESNRWMAATNTFRDKYFALPGDMTNAVSFWGQDIATNCSGSTGTVPSGTQTCNGNGNGRIGIGDPTDQEAFRFWQQLTNAGLIEGRYTGVVNLPWPFIAPNVNAPRSKISSSAGWAVQTPSMVYGTSFPNIYLLAGGPVMQDPVLKPEEAWNIDTKMDDGKPETGKVRGGDWASNCVTPTSPAAWTSTANDRTYSLTVTSNDCMMFFLM